jgi:hypothetical protein
MLGVAVMDITVFAVDAFEMHDPDSTAFAVMEAPNVSPETLIVHEPPAAAVVVPISEPSAYKKIYALPVDVPDIDDVVVKIVEVVITGVDDAVVVPMQM